MRSPVPGESIFELIESQTSGTIFSVRSERYESAPPENPPSFLYNAGLAQGESSLFQSRLLIAARQKGGQFSF